MPKREIEPTERLHVILYSSDVDYLRAEFGTDAGSIGLTRAIRRIVRSGVKQLREREAAVHKLPQAVFPEDYMIGRKKDE